MSTTSSDPNATEAPVTVLSTADWNRPLWTNKQHLSSRLAEHFALQYVDTMHLRRPELGDLRRVIQKLAAERSSAPVIHPSAEAYGIHHTRPNLLPYHRLGTWAQRINERRIRKSLLQPLGHLWSFSPVTYDLHREALSATYHAVDLLHTYPGVDAKAVLEWERRLASDAVRAIGSSPGVVEHLTSVGFDQPLYWPNVADIDLFADHALASKDRDIHVLFSGNLTDHKVHLELLVTLAARYGERMCVIGPLGEGGGKPRSASARLAAHGARVIPPVSQKQLAAYVGRARVAIIPYRNNAYTQGVFPMKLYEYLAGGCIVLSTPLRSLEGVVHEHLTVLPEEAFVDATADCVSVDVPDAQIAAQRSRLAAHDWKARVADICDLLRSSPQSFRHGSPCD